MKQEYRQRQSPKKLKLKVEKSRWVGKNYGLSILTHLFFVLVVD